MSGKKKIVWLSGSLHTIPPSPNSPGVPRIIHRFAEAMSETYDVSVISFHKGEDSEIGFDAAKYIQISHKGTYETLCRYIRIVPFRVRKWLWGMSNEKYIAYYLLAGKILKKIKPDLVISTMHIDSVRFVHKAVPKSKKVFYFRSSNIQEEGEKRLLEFGSYANGFISLTQQEEVTFKSYCKHIPTAVIGNFINEKVFSAAIAKSYRQKQRELWQLKEDDFVIGYAGRLTFTKGLDHLLKALISLSKDHNNIKLLIAGDQKIETKAEPAFLEVYEKLVQQLPANIIIKTGWIPNNDMIKFYSALDAALLLSQSREGHSMFGIESMCCGVPLIATKIGGNIEIVPIELKEDLIPVNDEQSTVLYRQLKHWLSNKNEYNRIREITKRHAEESFQFPKAKSKLIQFIIKQL